MAVENRSRDDPAKWAKGNSTSETTTPARPIIPAVRTGTASTSYEEAERDRAAAGHHAFLDAHHSSTGRHRHAPPSIHAGPLSIRDLWKPPIVRQFIRDGKLYRETGSREPSRLELFFDLAYAGIIHQIAEGTAEKPNAIGLARFILVFYPSWSIWKDLRDYSNVSGTDDIRMRLYILATMLLLYGYSANISAVDLERSEETGNWELVPESVSALHAAVAFYLIAKALRLTRIIEYARALPRFRIPLMLSGFALIINGALFIPATFVENATVLYALPLVAIILDIVSRYVLALLGRLYSNPRFTASHSDVCVPAINVEHLMERTLQFVVIVFGEVVINAGYHAQVGDFGPGPEYGRSAFAILIAFTLIWLYFDSDSSRTYVHALRRHWFTNVSYTLIHFPLTGAIIVYSASLARIIPESDVPTGVKWFFSGGIATALACIGLIGMLHKGMDQPRSALLPRSIRLALRFAIAVLLATFPLFQPANMTVTLAIVAAILSVLVLVETLGKLGSVSMDVDTSSGDESNTPRKNERAREFWNRHKGDLTEAEKGEEDVGAQQSMGDLEVKELHRSQLFAYTA